jgi:hypothetical protein
MERNGITAWVYVHEGTPFGKDREWKDLIQRINESARRLGVFLVEKDEDDEDNLKVGASDGLIPEEKAIEIIAATLSQVRDLVFAVQSFQSNISSHSHPRALGSAGQRTSNVKIQIIRSHPIWTSISEHLFKRMFQRMFQRLFKDLSSSTPRTGP